MEDAALQANERVTAEPSKTTVTGGPPRMQQWAGVRQGLPLWAHRCQQDAGTTEGLGGYPQGCEPYPGGLLL